jgi:FKBP-type peptidyl-prolyl cis-trans isomerase
MRYRLTGTSAVAFVLAIAACETSGGGTASLETDDQKASYAVGLNVGSNMSQAHGVLDMEAFAEGVRTAMAGDDPALEPAELQAAMQHLNERITEVTESAAVANRQAGEAYLAENAEREGVTTTESGLQYEVLEEGDGQTPDAGAMVTINYRGTLVDGTEFDSSYERGEPATFGVTQVIPGFSEALQLMSPGAHYRVVIPSDLAYGPQGSQGSIGPDETLIFEIEMISVQSPDSM